MRCGGLVNTHTFVLNNDSCDALLLNCTAVCQYLVLIYIVWYNNNIRFLESILRTKHMSNYIFFKTALIKTLFAPHQMIRVIERRDSSVCLLASAFISAGFKKR